MDGTTKIARTIATHYALLDRTFLAHPLISISKEGTILEIAQWREEQLDSLPGTEFFSGLIVPGFVNAHCHLELSHLRGAIPSGCGFGGFAAGMSRQRGTFGEQERSAAAMAADAAMWRQGIGAVADISNGSVSFAAKSSSDIHYHTFLELFGLNARPEDMLWSAGVPAGAAKGATSKVLADEALTGVAAKGSFAGVVKEGSLAVVAEEAGRLGLSHSSTPHSLYSLGDEAFRQAVEGFEAKGADKGRLTLHKREVCGQSADKEHCARQYGDDAVFARQSGKLPPLSLHFMESPGEAQLFEGRGEMLEWYRNMGWEAGFARQYASPADRLIALVPRERDIMLTHNCCVGEEDVDKILGHFTGRVTWVLCPRSNRYITGLRPPVEMLRRKGANIAVGTDSLASNHSLDMVEELKQLSGVPLAELLGWATEGGAMAIGVAGSLGSFEVGKKPGGVLITGIDWQNMSLGPDAKSERIF